MARFTSHEKDHKKGSICSQAKGVTSSHTRKTTLQTFKTNHFPFLDFVLKQLHDTEIGKSTAVENLHTKVIYRCNCNN